MFTLVGLVEVLVDQAGEVGALVAVRWRVGGDGGTATTVVLGGTAEGPFRMTDEAVTVDVALNAASATFVLSPSRLKA